MLTAQQRAVLDRGIALFSDRHMFAADRLTDRDHQAVDALRNDSIRAFGAGEAGALFAALTPPASLGHASAPFAKNDWDDCTCSSASDYCSGSLQCDQGDFCDHTDGGCGSGWLYDCDGLCL